MKFYFAPNSIAVATGMALLETGLPFEPIAVDFEAGEQHSNAFLSINPKGRVPALITEHGILTETGACLEYLSDLAPGAGLMPKEPFEAAQVRSLVHYLASTMHVNHAHNRRGSRWADNQATIEDMRAKVPETMTASCAIIEGALTGPFFFGAELTIADCHFFAISRWLEGDGVDVTAFPKIVAFREAMAARPSYAKAEAIELWT